MRLSPWFIVPSLVCLIVAIPILTILISLFQPRFEVWQYLWETRLLDLIWNTLRLAVGVGVGTFLLGTSLAWLVVMYQFPGKRFFEAMLLLPLAMPGYVIGFVFLSQWDYAGTIPTLYRQYFGYTAWFPEVRSYPGVVLVLTLVLYPYVYLLSRSAFREQNASLLEAARSLGVSRRQLFWKVALPLARPSIAVGVSLALMETLADFGTVGNFSYDTFTTAIYQMWFGLFDKAAAVQLAGMLLLFNLMLFYLEERTRGQSKYYQIHGSTRRPEPFQLSRGKVWIAVLYPSCVLGMAFVYPVTVLIVWVVQDLSERFDERYWKLLENTLLVSATTGVLTLCIAVLMAYSKRLFPGKPMHLGTRLASMGYALPGSVIAVGVLVPLSTLDHWLDDLATSWFDLSIGLLFTGSMLGMVFAYTVRFLAVAFNPVDTNLSKVTPTMDMAAHSLGASRRRVLRRIHLPLIESGMITGFIIVFVDVMKEMPATLLLRPFGYDTLATRIWELTSESYWEDAALPALTIVCSALIPVLLLIKLSKKT